MPSIENPRVLTSESVVTRNDAALDAAIDDDLIVVQTSKDVYARLDTTARRIWELLETPKSVGSLCDELSQEYGIGQTFVETDLLEFLAELEREEFIRIEP